jgi:hypothetical protein
MSVIYPAVTKYAPSSVTKVADDVLRPEIARDLLAISARPAAIKKVTATRVPEVIGAVRDVELLVKLIKTTDRRVITRASLAKHPKYLRAEHLLMMREHPWKSFTFDEVKSALQEERTYRGFGRDTVVKLTTWCRSLPEERQADAYRSIIFHDVNQRLYVPELVIDIMAGRVSGLSLSDIGLEVVADRPYKFARSLDSQYDRAMSSYDTIDVVLAHIISENGLKVPARSADRVSDEAIDHLLRTSSAVELVEQGLITDLNRLVSVVDQLQPETRGRLARLVSDPAVVAVLIDGLTYQTRPNGGDLADLLDRVPDLTFESRLVALSHANSIEVRDFFNGRNLNTPRPGELPAIVDCIRLMNEVEGYERWYHASMGTTIVLLGQCAPSATVLEGIERLLDTYRGVASNLLQDEGLVGRLTVERIRNHVGDTPAVWEMLLRLAGDWAGTIDELAATSRLL